MPLEPASQKPSGNLGLIFDENMTPVKPYLIQALYDWILDNDLTPLVVADSRVEGVRVPPSTIEDGKVVLNISMTATQGLVMEDDLITFSARFSGRSQTVVIPMAAVTAIYARENSKGMMFDVDHGEQTTSTQGDASNQSDQSDKTDKPKKPKGGGKPNLKLVD